MGRTRQIIIVRKDLNMSTGKVASQVAHASNAFMTNFIKKNIDGNHIDGYLDKDALDWINGIFTKTVCQAKNRYQLEKVKGIAEELGLKENEDYFLIKDNCLTELEPEETDENGIGRTLTCIGFRPLPEETAHKISKKYHLYI